MPVIVTKVPTIPDDGDTPVIPSEGITAKPTGLLAPPATVTITLPVMARAGTRTVIDVELQIVGVAVVPAKVTVLVPCLLPKPVPVIVTSVPTVPEVGFRFVILGMGSAINTTALLDAPPPVTVTFVFPSAAVATVTTM